MQMQPIVYRERYSNESWDISILPGFTPYQTENGEYVSERFVDIYFREWDQGSAMFVSVYDLVGGNPKKLRDYWIYDRPSNPEDPIPTHSQVMLIQAMDYQEFRGRYAEKIATDLYLDLVVRNPKSKFEQYLPEVVTFWKDHYERYGFKNQSN